MDVDRFWRQVDRSGGPDACWPWLGSRNVRRRGYGQVKVAGKVRRAHRVAFELAKGPIPDGMEPDHTCHDPDTCVAPCPHTACCNPAHLEAVTHRENVRRRTRSACSEGHPKTAEHGYMERDSSTPSGSSWRCRTCATRKQRERRAACRIG